MANARKCDICKRLYDLYNVQPIGVGDRKHSNTLVFGSKDTAYMEFVYCKTLDCCPECMGVINDLIDELEESNKEELNDEQERNYGKDDHLFSL